MRGPADHRKAPAYCSLSEWLSPLASPHPPYPRGEAGVEQLRGTLHIYVLQRAPGCELWRVCHSFSGSPVGWAAMGRLSVASPVH